MLKASMLCLVFETRTPLLLGLVVVGVVLLVWWASVRVIRRGTWPLSVTLESRLLRWCTWRLVRQVLSDLVDMELSEADSVVSV